MPLNAGTRLGRYEIRSQLGAGGMGEVYLAQDLELGRQVALKVLPPELAANHDRMRRFTQEAKAAAALNHPNVAHIYEIGEVEGINFIAMEYVDGKSLREKIHYERTDLRKLLRYLQQVASGLAKAHAAGIVHRDLKPDNVMVSRDGYAKILDFGLAKLIEIPTAGPGGETTSDAATVAQQAHSIPGRLMGTVGYMSPEQAQGKTSDIDHRSDVFSFGCMLFEAVTRRRPFHGESNVQSLYKIVYEAPPQIREFEPSAPPELQRIIRRCLAKDPDDRFQNIQDLAIELKDLRRELEGDTQIDITAMPSSAVSQLGGSQTLSSRAFADQTSVGLTGTDDHIATSTTSSAEIILGEIKKHKIGVLAALASFLIVVVAALFLFSKYGTRTTVEPFQAIKISRLTTGGKIGNASIKGYTSITPDGKYVVFRTTESGKDSLWVRQVSTGSLIKIVPDASGKIGGTTVSRDGEFIYYSVFETDDALGTLYQVPVLGGPPRRVMAGVTSPVTFSPDGKQLAFVRPSPAESYLITANVDGTGERIIATRKLPDYFSFIGGPSWSPDGSQVACGVGTFSGNSSGTIVAVPAQGGSEKPITSTHWASVSRALWTSDGTGLVVAAVPELVSAGTQLWYVGYPNGKVRRITNDLNAYGTTSLGLTADSKVLVTIQADKSAQLWLVTPGVGDAKQITSGKYDGDSLAWTPDGRVLYTAPAGEQQDVWSVDAEASSIKQITTDSYIEGLGCVSPDGRSLVFSSNRSGNFNIWRMDAASGQQQQLTQGIEIDSQPSCSPDGQWVIFKSLRQGKANFWKVPMAGGQPEQLVDKSSSWAALSPDGKLVALRYFDDRTNKNKITVLPFGGGEPITTLDVSLNFRDVGLGWTADSKSIIYADARDSADNLWALPINGGSATQLTNFTSGLIFAFQASRDAKQIALSRGTQTDDVILIRDAQ